MANGIERSDDSNSATGSTFIVGTSEPVVFQPAKGDQASAEKDNPASTVLQTQDAISTVAGATPSSTSTEVFVPRRRFQRGRLFVRGSRKKVWVGSFREDKVRPDGSITRIRRSVVLGETASVSRRAALATLQPFLDRVNIAPPPLPKSGKALLEAVADWRIQIAPNLKPSTVRAAESHLKQHIIPHLGTLRLSEFTVRVVQAFSTGLISGRTRKTVENVLQTLFSILQTARRFGSAVPAVSRTDIVLPNGGISREVRFFDAEQVGKIVAATKEPHSTMFAVLGMTGLRAGGMLGLKVSDLDFTRKVIHVRRSIDSRTRQEQTPKSRGSASDVPMPAALEKRLLEFLRAGYRENLNGYLFANRNGNPYSIGKVTEYGLWPALKKLKIERAGLHAFRHAAASELLEQGAPLTVVQRQLRHRDARTTLQKYGHVVGDAQRRAVEMLADNIERHAAVELEPSGEMEPSVA
jgi:integrase